MSKQVKVPAIPLYSDPHCVHLKLRQVLDVNHLFQFRSAVQCRTRDTDHILFMSGKIQYTPPILPDMSQTDCWSYCNVQLRIIWGCNRNGKNMFTLGCYLTVKKQNKTKKRLSSRFMGTPKAVNHSWVISCWSWRVACEAPTCSMQSYLKWREGNGKMAPISLPGTHWITPIYIWCMFLKLDRGSCQPEEK